MIHDASQESAIAAAVRSTDDVVITGGAGTGKSTCIKAIAEQLDGRVEIMAPTGKAAARVKEATGYPAYTIHRCLQWDGTKVNRHGDFKVPLIIDESSMIDSEIMATVLRFNPPKLILVGDQAQLAPVGRGQPFHDIINLRPEIVQNLTHCWRAQGAVHKAAQAIRAGTAPLTVDTSGGETWRMVESGGSESTIAKLLQWVQAGHYDPKQDVILSPRYGDGETDSGIFNINREVKKLLNPSDEKWAVGDRVICNKNFGADDLWNGDLGFITDIDVSGQLWVQLDRDPSPRLMSKEQAKEFAHAYALSVHKSQGSQFRRVFVLIQRAHWFQLTRSLIYTAITRAQKGVCVMGEMSAFYHGINNDEKKNTVMQFVGRAA